MALADIAQGIILHAATGPADTPGQKVRNQFSPHLERYIVEQIRAHIIKETNDLKQQVALEMSALVAISPEPMRNQVELSANRINSYIQQLAK